MSAEIYELLADCVNLKLTQTAPCVSTAAGKEICKILHFIQRLRENTEVYGLSEVKGGSAENLKRRMISDE